MSNPFHPRGNRRFAQGTPRAHKRNVFVALTSPLLAMVLACAGNGNQSVHVRPAQSGSSSAPVASASASANTVNPCEHARELLARVPKLLDEGKLRRAQRVLVRADALCQDLHPTHADVDALILAELGQWQDAEKVIADIEASKDKVAMGTPLLAKAKQRVATGKQMDPHAPASKAERDKDAADINRDFSSARLMLDKVSPDVAKSLADAFEHTGASITASYGHSIGRGTMPRSRQTLCEVRCSWTARGWRWKRPAKTRSRSMPPMGLARRRVTIGRPMDRFSTCSVATRYMRLPSPTCAWEPPGISLPPGAMP